MPNKFNHVRSAQLDPTRTHTCHWPGCKVEVPPARWGCLEHWQALPKSIRNAIWNAYEIGQENDPRLVSHAYVQASNRALDWIRAQATANEVADELRGGSPPSTR